MERIACVRERVGRPKGRPEGHGYREAKPGVLVLCLNPDLVGLEGQMIYSWVLDRNGGIDDKS